MRTLGMLAIFLLAVCAIAEGAFLFRLSGRVQDLSRELAAVHEIPLRPAGEAAPAAERRPAPAPRPVIPARPAAPPPAFTAPAPSTAATTTLRDALATTEGRDQLRAALDVIAEQRRQERIVKVVERREERDQRWKERVSKVPLTGDEPQKINALFATLATGRRQLVEDMKAGVKNAEDTDTAMDELQDNTQKALRTLLGDERWNKMQSDRQGRGGGRQGNGQRGNGPPRPGAPPAPPAGEGAAARGG
jgi:hypothetical protein